MHLNKLSIHGIRNIEQADLALSAGVNLIYGENGSGKTSILEAIHLLSMGRSFRTRNLKNLIQHGQKDCTCFGRITNNTLGVTPVGVNRSANGGFIFKVDGQQVYSASKLAEVTPLQLINADSFQLLTGAPSVRRSFLDWGVFHVEQDFRDNWSRFQRCLKHRNSLLRRGNIDSVQIDVWDREFISLAEKIDRARKLYLDQLLPELDVMLNTMNISSTFNFDFYSGWDDKFTLQQQLEKTLQRDQKAGFSSTGPHRAELKILLGKSPASEILSRGQIKMLVSALKLAQGQLFSQQTGKSCLYLLDDLPSELDQASRLSVSRQLAAMKVQVFVTGVDLKDLQSLWPADVFEQVKTQKIAVFHVEQGKVSEKQQTLPN